MTLDEIGNILEATGFSVAYSHFKDKQKLPFICYKESFTQNFKADDRVYKKRTFVDVELYTKYKDQSIENKVEQALNDNSIPWDVVETFIEEENVFQRVYEISI